MKNGIIETIKNHFAKWGYFYLVSFFWAFVFYHFRTSATSDNYWIWFVITYLAVGTGWVIGKNMKED